MAKDLSGDGASRASHSPPYLRMRVLRPGDATDLAAAAALATPPGHVDHATWLSIDRPAYWSALLAGDGPCGPVVDAASRVLVDDSGTVAGCAVVTLMPASAWWPGGPWLPEVFVVPAHQRGGLGDVLVSHAIRVCSTEDHARIGLTVTDGNPARRLYERLGFTPFRSTWVIGPGG